MNIPQTEALLNVALEALRNLGGSATDQAHTDEVANLLELPEAVHTVKHPSGQTLFAHRLAWARHHLSTVGLLTYSVGTAWSFTEEGLAVTAVDPEEVMRKVHNHQRGVEAEMNEALEDLRLVQDRDRKISLLNGLGDKLASHNLEVGFLEDLAEDLIFSILIERDLVARGAMFELVERIFAKELSVNPSLEPLIEAFDEQDPGLIANTLMLLPYSGHHSARDLAERYRKHLDPYVQKNAAYALKSLSDDKT